MSVFVYVSCVFNSVGLCVCVSLLCVACMRDKVCLCICHSVCVFVCL